MFMVDIGMVAAGKIGQQDDKSLVRIPLVMLGILMPLLFACCGLVFASAVGLSLGNAMLFAVLCASASYIAVPAALRIALPNANLPLAILMSLAITFPFNVIIGMPLYFWLAELLLL